MTPSTDTLVDARARFLGRAVEHGRVGGYPVPAAVGTGAGVLRAATPEERAEFAAQLLDILHLKQQGVDKWA